MKRNLRKAYLISLLHLLLTLALSACGGGGGGGGSDNEEFITRGAEVEIEISERKLQVGDRLLATVSLQQVSKNGLILKIRFPSALKYTKESSYITVDGKQRNIDPLAGPKSNGTTTVLAYHLPKSFFNGEDDGKVFFQLRAASTLTAGSVEVDQDIYNPAKALEDQFNIDNPLFAAEDLMSLAVL
jgi:hypothetical protein